MKTICSLLLATFAGFAQAAPLTVEELKPKMEAMAAATGSDYIGERDAVVALSSNALPALRQCQLSNETWQIQIVAGICRERIERGDAIKTMITKDWRKDSDWNNDWDLRVPNPPSYTLCKDLMVQRYREAGLSYYYLELFWKDTGETPDVGSNMKPSCWSDLSLTVLTASPLLEMVARVMEDKMIKGGGLNSPWVEYLVGNKVRSSMPVLIELFESSSNPRTRETALWPILSLANTNDIPVLKEFIRRNATNEDVRIMSESRLRELLNK